MTCLAASTAGVSFSTHLLYLKTVAEGLNSKPEWGLNLSHKNLGLLETVGGVRRLMRLDLGCGIYGRPGPSRILALDACWWYRHRFGF